MRTCVHSDPLTLRNDRYSSLVSEGRKGKMSRKEQILAWCGPDFEGCLIFDECHKAKNFAVGKDNDTSKSTKVAQAVVDIQRRLPLARVLYCSATGVSELSDLAFMERLGLW